MQAGLKWRKSLRGADILRRLVVVLMCVLALALLTIGHANYAGATSASPIFQTTGHPTCGNSADGAMGLASHCGQHNACGQLLLAQSNQMAKPQRALTPSVEPDFDFPDRPMTPPYRPPKSASAALVIAA